MTVAALFLGGFLPVATDLFVSDAPDAPFGHFAVVTHLVGGEPAVLPDQHTQGHAHDGQCDEDKGGNEYI